MPSRRHRIPTPWEFVPDDEQLDGSDHDDMAGPERAAMHVQGIGHPRAARDAGRSDVELGPPGDHGEAPPQTVSYFDDEVDEDGREEDMEEDEHDLEDLLVVQHYLSEEEQEEEEEEEE